MTHNPFSFHTRVDYLQAVLSSQVATRETLVEYHRDLATVNGYYLKPREFPPSTYEEILYIAWANTDSLEDEFDKIVAGVLIDVELDIKWIKHELYELFSKQEN